MADQGKKQIIETATPQQVAIANINPSGLIISLKLTRDNFLLWRTQLLPILAVYEQMDHIEQDPLEVSSMTKDGQIFPNPAYKTWYKNDKVILAIITSSFIESTMPIVVGKEIAKEAWEAINRNFAGKSQSRIMEL